MSFAGHKTPAISFCCHWHLHVLFILLRIDSDTGLMVLQPDVVQGEGDRVQRFFTLRWFQFALPYRDAVPAHLRQLTLLLLVPFLVPPYLRHPEVAVRLRNLAALRISKYVFTPLALWRGVRGETPMPMPEASIHEDACPVLPQHQVRMSRQSLIVQSVSESPTPQPTMHNQFWLRVLRMDCSHIGTPLLWR